jgi:hypothetical protein
VLVRTLLVAAFVFVATLALALPEVLANWPLLPDAIEHLGIAHSWVSGAGFVDPVLYSQFLPDTTPPVPALLMRAPVVPLLLAVPLALGGGVQAVLVAHAVFAAALGAAGVWVARRIGPGAAPLVFGVGFALSFPWILAVQSPNTEAASIGALLAITAWAPRALRSRVAAVGFGALCAIAWLTRPNLAVALPAFVVAAFVVLGPRQALRSAPLWIAVGTFAALQSGVSLWCHAATGFAPYAHYGVLLQSTSASETFAFQKQYPGALAWLAANGDQARAALAWNAHEVMRLLFALPDYHYLGWFALPALADAWRRRDAHRLERLLLAATGLALLGVVLAGYGAIDPRRLLLPAALCFWLLTASWLAHAALRLGANPFVRAAPALLVLALWLLSPSASGTGGWALRAWRAYQQGDTRTGLEQSFAPPFCAALDRDAIVASPNPWELYLACGNAGQVLPRDLDGEALLQRYLDERAPGYLIVPADATARFDASPRLARLATERSHSLFEVENASPRTRPWLAPPPLAPPAR